GKPYSKRDGDAYVGDFKNKGFLPEALFNYLALLGWSPGDDREKMTKDEMISAFSLDRVKSSPGKFDIHKLMNMNGSYISEMQTAKFAEKAYEFTVDWKEIRPTQEDFAKIATVMQSRTKVLTQADEWKYFFSESYEVNSKELQKLLSKTGTGEALSKFRLSLATLNGADSQAVEACIRDSESSAGIQKGGLNQLLRLVLTGAKSGPSIEDVIKILGTDKCATRIDRCVAQVENHSS
ncbi:MAG TPA: glutamate--tRNA ligase family protein, partial [Victivallales bacterium]|nr:glutamate--tRNA ligase family protein [Victivallales bacterium]